VDRPLNTAGWVFGTAALGVVEGFVEAVEVLFRPSGPELALVDFPRPSLAPAAKEAGFLGGAITGDT